MCTFVPNLRRAADPGVHQWPGPGFEGPRPVLIMIHGGPAVHYSPGFSLLENYLLGELGIALVMPNASVVLTGYGRSYERLDDGRRRPDAVRDLVVLLDWIAKQPDLDASRVAVSGGSHGGYLALAATAQFGDRLRAGIDIAGVSSFETSLDHERPSAIDYWRLEYGDQPRSRNTAIFPSISPCCRTRTGSRNRCWSFIPKTTSASGSARPIKSSPPWNAPARWSGTFNSTARATTSNDESTQCTKYWRSRSCS